MTSMLEKIIIPEGWTKEAFCRDNTGNVIVLNVPSQGSVTIDFNRRWWNLGYGYSSLFSDSGCNSAGKKYAGRTWRNDLLQDAINAFKKAWI